MSQTKPLSLAVWRYDRTQPLYDNRVSIPGYDVNLIDAPLEDIFSRALEKAEFDVTELSFSNYMRLTAQDKCPYLGLPLFPSRSFRHGAFYVRDDDSIRTPADLAGRTIGVREYSMTAALAARGALRDHYGVESEKCHWVMGDVDEKERHEIHLPRLFKPISIEAITDGRLLSTLLLEGEIDAILAYKPIEPFRKGEGVRRLLSEHTKAEAEYFSKTGVFPIMHLMGIRKDVATAEPTLPAKLMRAFSEAQSMAEDDLRYEQALKIGLPWLNEELRRTVSIMGDDYWPHGIERNRHVIEQMVRWSFEDGLIPRQLSVEELFPIAL